jgi:hypothetical protein
LHSVVILLFILAILGADSARASSVCPSPRANTPALSFSIPSFTPGGLDRYCAVMVAKGVSFGFTAVTITPEIAFDRNSNSISTQAVTAPGEITRCLETAREAGLDIIYSPHVEDHTQNQDFVWRAKLDLHPNASYYGAGFGEFMSWLQSRAPEILSADQTIRVTLEAELEKSTTTYPGEWRNFTKKLKKMLASSGLEGRITLGIQPNWRPDSNPGFWECRDFRDWISSLDWIAPSMYGDWSHTKEGSAQPEDRIEEILQRLTRSHHFLCKVPEFASKPLSFGELGIGTDIQHTERWAPVTAQQLPAFTTEREAVYSNLFSWMETEAPKSGYSRFINLWVLGIYDPVGFGTTPSAVPDPVIEKQARDYTNWRCRGADTN